MNSISIKLAILFTVPILSGCRPNEIAGTKLTPSTVRAERRAYDGAPPVIPHEPLSAACTSCHTSTGMQIPSQGFAPANPHVSTSQAAATDNCRQCHLFQTTKQHFAKSNFEPLRQDLKPGERLFLGAPPVIPHPTFMRENCQSCHTGAAARPEIRCTHPERANCTQCHVTKTHRSNQQVDASTDRAPPFPKRVGPM